MASFRITSTFSLLLLISSLLQSVLAIEVTPGSPCAALCMDDPDGDPFSPDSSTTNATDIVCQDSAFSSTEKGAKFKDCLECLQKSDKSEGTESDIAWLLYNLRHAMGTCLYGFGDKDLTISSPCVIGWACEPIKDAILAGDLDPEDKDTFGYCSAADGAFFGETLKSCVSCLKSSDDETYLGNFMVALQVGCVQKPGPGEILGISGSPFTRAVLEVTTETDEDEDPGASPSALTTGTIVGIAVGAALFVFGGLALWYVYRRKKKNSHTSSGDPKDPNNSRSSSRAMISLAVPWGRRHDDRDEKRSGSASSRERDEKDEEDQMSRHLSHHHHHQRIASRSNRNTIRSTHLYDPSVSDRPLRGRTSSSVPAYPAYNPTAANRDGSTPTPPLPNRAYQHHQSHSSDPSTYANLSPPPSYQAHARNFSQPMAASEYTGQAALPQSFVMPPPPPRAPEVPSIPAPSVPRVRGAKTYTPPTISIDPVPEPRGGPRYVRV